MSKADFEAMTARLMTDRAYQNVNVQVVDLWLLLCACQLTQTTALLHDPLKEMYLDLGRRLQAILEVIHPDAKALIEAGWDADEDFVEWGDDDLAIGPLTIQWLKRLTDADEEDIP